MYVHNHNDNDSNNDNTTNNNNSNNIYNNDKHVVIIAILHTINNIINVEATVHASTLLHAVTAMTAGERYYTRLYYTILSYTISYYTII